MPSSAWPDGRTDVTCRRRLSPRRGQRGQHFLGVLAHGRWRPLDRRLVALQMPGKSKLLDRPDPGEIDLRHYAVVIDLRVLEAFLNGLGFEGHKALGPEHLEPEVPGLAHVDRPEIRVIGHPILHARGRPIGPQRCRVFAQGLEGKFMLPHELEPEAVGAFKTRRGRGVLEAERSVAARKHVRGLPLGAEPEHRLVGDRALHQ